VLTRLPVETTRLVSLALALATTALGLASTSPAIAQDGFDGEARYELDERSAWLEGCIVGSCLCPIKLFEELSGSFRLVELPTLQPGPWRLFELSDLRWQLRRGDELVEIRGSGLYRTAAPVLDEQRLILELTLDGEPIEPLDSGTVGGGLAFPSIEIEALTAGACYQEGTWLSANPLEPTPDPAPEPASSTLLVVGALFLALLYGRRGRKWQRA
jgi:hypothetical protein